MSNTVTQQQRQEIERRAALLRQQWRAEQERKRREQLAHNATVRQTWMAADRKGKVK